MSTQFPTDLNLWKLLLLMMLSNGIAGLPNVPLLASWTQSAITVAGQADGTAGSANNYLYWNRGISISDDDTLYIADRVNNRVVFLNLGNTNRINTFRSQSGSDVDQFNYPADLRVTDTSVYVLDTNNYRVQKYLRNGTDPVTMPGAGTFGASFNLFVDKYDNLYLSLFDDNQVIHFASNSSNSTVVAGDGTQGLSPTQLSGPNGLTVDDAGTIYVADTQNHRIQKWTSGATAGITVAGTGVSGSSVAQLSSPESLTVDTNGYMYIVDRGNNRIVRWRPGATWGICIAACTSVSGYQSNQLYYPIDLAFDSSGSLYVSDDGNSRVQKFQIVNSTAQMTTEISTTLRTTTPRSLVTMSSQSSTFRAVQSSSSQSSSAAMMSIMWAAHLVIIGLCQCFIIAVSHFSQW